MSNFKNYVLNIVCIIFFSSTCNYSFGQVGINTITPHESSIFDVESNDKGVLFPRLSTQARDGIVNPPTGLLIYNINTNSLEWFNGTIWVNPNVSPQAPTNLTPFPSNTKIDLSWTAPVGVVGNYIISYKLVSEQNWNTITSPTNSVQIAGLQNNSTYVFKVKAVNIAGESTDSQLLYSSPIANQLLLYENFNSGIFDANKWYEYDNAQPSNNPSAGGVTIDNGRLKLVTPGYDDNKYYLRTAQAYGKVAANLVIDMDVIYPTCTTNSLGAFKYGKINNNTYVGNSCYFFRKSYGSQIEVGVEGAGINKYQPIANCVNQVPMHMKIVFKTSGEVQFFINGVLQNSLNVSAAQFPSSIREYPFYFAGYQSEPLYFDNIVISGLPTVPSSPENIIAQSGNTSAGVSFSTPLYNGGSSIVNYTVTSTPGNIIATGTSSPIIVSGLTNGTPYTFSVTANNAYGSSLNSVASNSIAPANQLVPLLYAQNGKILLQWQSTYDATDYLIEYKESTAGSWLQFNDGVSIVTHSTITGLTNGISYDVRIKPLSSNNIYDFSQTVTATPTSSYSSNVWHHIMSTGQSLSLGQEGMPVLSSTQPYSNKKLNTSFSSLIPLIETQQESMSSALGNTITQQTVANDFNAIVTLNGMGGQPYSGLKRGTNLYNLSIDRIKAVKQLTNVGLQKVNVVDAITVVHGETDHYIANIAQYKAFLEEWQNDYQTDIQAITGQTDIIPMFTCQVSSWGQLNFNAPTIALAQLQAAVDNPTKIYLVTPKYIFDYADNLHMKNYSYRRLGEYYGKAMKKVLVDKQPWVPLSPSTVSRIGNVITVNFNVPVAPLQFDTSAVLLKANYGFEYINNGSGITITNVAIGSNGTSVEITLSATPTTPGKVAYAYSAQTGSGQGSGRYVATAPRGNLCDSDSTLALNQDSGTPANMGNTLKNWCVTFLKDVN